jgi:hypothetical protein
MKRFFITLAAIALGLCALQKTARAQFPPAPVTPSSATANIAGQTISPAVVNADAGNFVNVHAQVADAINELADGGFFDQLFFRFAQGNVLTLNSLDAGSIWIQGGLAAANGNFLVNGATGAISLIGGATASNGVQINAGTSGIMYPAVLTLKIDTTVNGSGADTTEDDLTKFSIPTGSLSANGKAIHFVAWGDNNAGNTTDVETVRCYFGHATTLKSGTLLISRVLTASQANTWNVIADISRTGSATEVATATLFQGGTAVATVQTNSSPSGDTTGAMLIGCTGQRATSSVASSLRQLGLVVQEANP